jgi:hypothetical protein
VCFYPILDYPGWDNDRHCDVGLLTTPDQHGRRAVCEALRDEIERQQMLFQAITQRPQAAPRSAALSMVSGDD